MELTQIPELYPHIVFEKGDYLIYKGENVDMGSVTCIQTVTSTRVDSHQLFCKL